MADVGQGEHVDTGHDGHEAVLAVLRYADHRRVAPVADHDVPRAAVHLASHEVAPKVVLGQREIHRGHRDHPVLPGHHIDHGQVMAAARRDGALISMVSARRPRRSASVPRASLMAMLARLTSLPKRLMNHAC